MYLQNKYSHCYYSIIDRTKSRVLPKETYTETHHIVPRSLGGSDDQSNLVKLTAREHFICHLLLPKMTTGKNKTKMIYAAWCLSMLVDRQKQFVIKSRTYANIKTATSAIRRSSVPWNKGKQGLYKQSAESNQRRSKSLQGRPSIDKGKFGERSTFYGKKHSDATKRKISQATKGRVPWNKGRKNTVTSSTPISPK